jgi:hypothetical protein
MDGQHVRDFFDITVLYLLGEPMPELPAIPGRVHQAPPADGHDTGHPREHSLDRALQFAAAVADRRHWRHRT